MEFNRLPEDVQARMALLLTALIILLLAIAMARRLLFSRSRVTSPYHLQFPPSRQHVLARLPQFKSLAAQAEIPPEILSSQALPTTKNGGLGQDNLYTPTGFSTQQIRALGRFPDYPLLSGVRHPEPCGPEWDISKATFRPFRPFRWKYHQHMGISPPHPSRMPQQISQRTD